jgi:hypothetical protein
MVHNAREIQMKMAFLRRAATGFATIAAASFALVPFAPAASAAVSPQSVTYFQFQNGISNGKCLDVGGQVNGSVVQLFACNGTVNQQWTMQPTDSGYFQLMVASSGRCLEVAGASQDLGARVQILDCNRGLNQHWRQVTSTTSGRPLLQVRHSNQCLTALGNPAERAPMLQATCFPDIDNQKWSIT